MTHYFSLLPAPIVSEILCLVVISIQFQEVQHLRLLSRLLNHETLFAFYVCLGRDRPRIPPNAPPRLLRFAARRSLQGHLTRFPHDEWTANISRAIETLEESSGASHSLHLQRYPCSFYFPSTSIFDNPASNLICDALVGYYSPLSILNAIYEFDDRTQEFSYRKHHPTCNPSFLMLLAAHYAGDLSFVRKALNKKRILEDNSVYCHELVSSFLPVVSQQDHLDLMEYLLGAGFDVNHISDHSVSTIVTTSREGSRSMLDLILRPKYGLKRSGDEYTRALHSAAEHHNTTFRLEAVKTLYLAGEGLDQPYIRESLFFRACRKDDTVLARWLLADGPVSAYRSLFRVPVPTRSILHWLARQGKCEWIQWLLQEQPPIFGNDYQRSILAAALDEIANGNHTEMFFQMAKYFAHDSQKLCLLSAVVENGLLLLPSRILSLDLQTTLSREATLPCCYEGTVGSQALLRAIQRGRFSNVQMLLERGVRTSSKAHIRKAYYDKHKPEFLGIETMLISHANPMFEISSPCDASRMD